MLDTLPETSLLVSLPKNIQRIETQADLYGAGVAVLNFTEVVNEQEAIERAEGMPAFLLKSNKFNWFYLIFPVVIDVEYVERKKK